LKNYYLTELINNYLMNERVAGWEKEYDMLRFSKDLVCGDVCGEAIIHSIETLRWSQDKCIINRNIGCSIQPPFNGDIVLEGYLTNDINNCRDKILLASATDYPDNIWILYNHAVEKGALGVIFYDYYPDRKRRIVINGEWHYSFNESIKSPIPAVHIKLNDYPSLRRFLEKKISIDLKSTIDLAKGYILDILIEKDPYREIIISAHHDSWFTGFRDDGIGLLTILSLAKNLSNKLFTENMPTIRLLSFSAEEFGDPRNPGWYWAYGSRYYLDKIFNTKDLLTRTMVSIVIDTAFKEHIHVSYSYPDLGYFFIDKFSMRSNLDGYGHPYMDSISFIRNGIPTITLYNFSETIPVYHTDLDTPYSGWINFLEKFSLSLLKIASKLRNENILKPRLIVNELKEYLPTSRYERLSKYIWDLKDSMDYMHFHSCFAKTLIKPVVFDSYKRLYSDIHLYPLYMVSRIKDVDKIIIPGEEAILNLRDDDSERLNSLSRYIESMLDELEECLIHH